MVTTPPPTRPGTVARDFYALRRDGIAGIERAGHRQWTDYNSHDPGITILEAFAYAVTDLAYRTDFDVADLLGPQRGPDPYPGQVFFGPRDILTVNPTTAPDLRRLLVDLPGVRNAWLRTDCRCGPSPDRSPGAGCAPAGLYEVTLELEAEPTVGDLNDRVTRRRRWLTDADGRRRGVTVEVWFPRWRLADGELRHRLIGQPGPVQVAVAGPFRTTTGSTPVGDEELRTHWHEVFFVDLDLDLADGSTLRLPRAALRLYGDAAARRLTDGQTVRGWLADPGDIGFVEAYRRKLALADAAVGQAVTALHAHRNLAEDACRVTLVEVTPVAVCADVEVQPGADLAEVQARLWFEVEEYLDPAPVFASPAGLLADGIPVEDVFNGPALTHGVLTDQTLTDTDRRVDLRVSDLLNRLMDVPGVAGVEHLQLTGYDDAGRPVAGLADPDWSAGPAVFDPDGFLLDPAMWSESLAERIARNDGIGELSELQMALLHALRREYLRHGSVTALSHVCHLTGQSADCMQHLFPGPREAWRVAGLPNPGEEARAYLY